MAHVQDKYVCTRERSGCIQTLRDWCIAQPHLNSRLDDGFLLRFLRVGKFIQLRAQELIDNYWSARSADPQWFTMDPQESKMQELLDLGIFVGLKGRDSIGRRIYTTNYGQYDPDTCSVDDIMKFSIMIMEHMTSDEYMQIHGCVVIEDAAGLGMKHVKVWTKDVMSKMMKVFQDGYPMRLKEIHYINLGPVFNTIFELFKYFMKEKMRNRIKLHWNDDSLQKMVSKKILPTEYGGEAGPIREHIKAFKEEIVAAREEILYNQQARFNVDESKRIKVEKEDEGWGLMGAYRRLNIE
ncbi:unnamed protein product [Owenia fusiformis]|uniref:CRAL-TRIO domain-containing protein n=1 Tax=Owenia fusiformis TaxID=6347 RepID=A0A8S4Q022_OWEFU|nr:unnamed protein product [Owenia fusiformis]